MKLQKSEDILREEIYRSFPSQKFDSKKNRILDE
jgi:hypothetical protein